MPDYQDILVDVSDAIGTITLNRPEKLNALSRTMGLEVGAAMADFGQRDDVRVIVLKGAGRAFCAGADLTPSGPTVTGPHSVPEDVFGLDRSIAAWLSVWHHPKPVIAQVHGYCIGGGAHAASFADLVIVAEDAQIGWPKLPVGGGFISPVWSWFVGPRRAKEFSFNVGVTFTGKDACEMGWANRAVPAAELESTVRDVAKRIARVPSDVLAVKKRALNNTMDIRGFSQAIQMTAAWDAIAHASPNVDFVRGKIRELGLRGAITWFEEGGFANP